jgi:hypothetical protein
VPPRAVGTLFCPTSSPIFILNCLSRCPPPPPGGRGLGGEGGGGGGVGCGMGPLASVPHPFSVCWNPLANRFRCLFGNIFGSKYSFLPSISITQQGGGDCGRISPAKIKFSHKTKKACSGVLAENWSKVRISSGDNTHKISAS